MTKRYQELVNTPFTLQNIGKSCVDIVIFGFPRQIIEAELGYKTSKDKVFKKIPITARQLNVVDIYKNAIIIFRYSLRPSECVSFKVLSDRFIPRDRCGFSTCDIGSISLHILSNNTFPTSDKTLSPLKTYGNIMSLISSKYQTLKIIKAKGIFDSLFTGNDNLVDASELVLPATKLSDKCYSRMFEDCCNLEYPPTILPAKSLGLASYKMMFSNTGILRLPYIKALYEYTPTQLYYACNDMFTFSEKVFDSLKKQYSVFILNKLNSL